MKLVRSVFLGLAVAGAIVFISRVSFAQMAQEAGKDSSAWKAKHEAKIKLLQDSAFALRETNPDIAKQLANLAGEEAKEPSESMESSEEKAGEDSPEWKAKHDEKIKLYNDAAMALQKSHPDLAKDLAKLTVSKRKIKTDKKMQEKNEKEEAGEKMEPKPEQGEAK